jgi:hypothetical protein
MPPKASTEIKKKQKAVEDKTFGLKNKNKSSKVQKYINDLQKNALSGQKELLQKQKEAEARRAAKKAEQEELRQLEMLKKAAAAAEKKKEAAAQQMKQQVCPFFVKGKCPKGDECKMSHDWGETRKVAKQDLYKDPREGTPNEAQNEITCMYFLESVEKKLYGVMWKCPNGAEKCAYQHKLPKGFVFDDKKEEEAPLDERTLEEKIEDEREELLKSEKELTPITEDSLQDWLRRKRAAKEKKIEEERIAAEKKLGNRGISALSGRALFSFDPTLFIDDADAADAGDVELRGDEEEEEKKQNDPKVQDESLFTDDVDLPDSDID